MQTTGPVKPALQNAIEAENPSPRTLPALSVRRWEPGYPERDSIAGMVGAAFPNVPDFHCDSWCYENDLDYIGVRALNGGALEMAHRWREHTHVRVVTIVRPEKGAVEFLARLERDDETRAWPDRAPHVNLCWQLKACPGFKSQGEHFTDFVKRCFIFTPRGHTFLHETERRLIPALDPDAEQQKPFPWVQMYCGIWQQAPTVEPKSWADYSSDRYTHRIIGAVSRDGKFLAALASSTAELSSNAWNDCLHSNPEWAPANAPMSDRRWRLKVYVMKNDPILLLKRAKKDFPGVRGDG